MKSWILSYSRRRANAALRLVQGHFDAMICSPPICNTKYERSRIGGTIVADRASSMLPVSLWLASDIINPTRQSLLEKPVTRKVLATKVWEGLSQPPMD